MRIHQFKKVTLNDYEVKVIYMVETSEDEFEQKKEVIFTTNPARDIQKYNTGNNRILKWQVIGERKVPYKVEKAAMEQWVREHGKPITEADDKDDIDE